MMTLDQAMALLGCADAEFLKAAGPAVLRLKLLEVNSLSHDPRRSVERREAARFAARELRALILERPCASLIDSAAKQEITRALRAA